jgi:serine protease AprX|tara:strand:+ start:601 stop:1815 length:1215 start_codon:yes stop_codon:yes gene_type:complete
MKCWSVQLRGGASPVVDDSDVDWATVEMPEFPNEQEQTSFFSEKRVAITISIVSAILIISSVTIAGVGLYQFLYQNAEKSGPPSDLLDWQDDFRTLTGLDNVSATGTGVSVCVVDTGIDLTHSDFVGKDLTGWKDFINDQETPYDDQGHGTAMAGLIWANDWMKGVSPGADLYVAKAMSSDGEGVDETIAAAVDWCVDSGVDVISLSLGGAAGFNYFLSSTDSLENSVDSAISSGVFVVAAAGNDGENDDGDVSSPGSVEDVICVGGVDSAGSIWVGSSEGDNNGRFFPLPPIMPRSDPDKKPEVTGPGEDVPILIPLNLVEDGFLPWGYASGTSAATAWISGGIALLLEEKPELQRDGSSGGSNAISDVKQWISESSSGQESHDSHYGYGILNAEELISVANS